MKATKRIASLLLCGAMTLSFFPTPALAEVFAAAGSGESESKASCTCTELCAGDSINADCPVCGEKGADLSACKGVGGEIVALSSARAANETGVFNVNGGTLGTDYTYSEPPASEPNGAGILTVNTSTHITISTNSGTASPANGRIVIGNGVTANITLAGLSIKPADSSTSDGCSGIDLASGATLNISLQSGSSNVINGGKSSTAGTPAPGIHVPEGSTLTIKGEGSLKVNGASDTTAAAVGIGGMGSSSGAGGACGNVIILGGAIAVHGGTSTTGSDPVDIGGGATDNGNGGDCGTVIILTSVNSGGSLEIGGGAGVAVGGGKGSDGAGIKPTSDGTYIVYGDLTLPCDVTIPEGATVVIPEGASLTVPESTTLTNNGTILVQGGTFTNNGTVTGNQPAYPSTVTVSFSQNGQPVTSVPYGSTVTITATMEKAETATNALEVDPGMVGFYLGEDTQSGILVGTDDIEIVNGVYTAAVDVTLDDEKGVTEVGTITITAVFGGYASEGNESGDSLAPNTGSAQLTVAESYTIDYEEETITIAEGFSLYAAESGGNAIFTSTASSDTTSLTNYIQNNERNLYLQAPAAEGENPPERREITIPARPAASVAPTINYSEEKLSFTPDVTETTLEYALSQSDQNWQDVPSGAALSDMGWNGNAEKTYYFRKGATDTSFASSETTAPVTAPPRPEAPEGLLLQDWTDVSLSFYVGAGVQCRLGNEGAWVTLGQNETDHTFTGLTPQTTYTIYARYPATESQFASAEASAEGTTKSSAADAPEVGAATVTDTTVTLPYDTAWEYKMGDGDWRSILNPNVFTSLTAATQYTYHVRVKETETAEASEIATVTVWTAYAAPTGVQGGANKITGVTADMEYKLNTAEEWTECGGTEVTGLAAGNYQVRHKEDVGGAPASEAVTVIVDKGEQAKPEGEISLISSTENSLSVNFFSNMSENNAGVEIAYAKGLTANTPTSEWITVNKFDGSIVYSATIDQLSPGTPYVLFVRYKENDYFKPSQPITSGALYTKPKITTLSLPNAYVGVAYSAQLEAVAAEGTTVSWSLMEGSSLPAGLTLSTDGIISGTPTAATPQEATFIVAATIGEGTNSVSSGTAFVITISRSEAELGNLTVSGDTGITEGAFQYGDTITVTFTPERSGDIATNALAENTATLTYTNAEGEAVMLATAAAQVDGSFTLSYDTKEKRLPTGEDLPLRNGELYQAGR